MTERRLTLLRHGNASAGAVGGDFHRPLDARGRQEVAAAATTIAEFHRPDLIVASNALRTLETAHVLAAALDYPVASITLESQLYLADCATLRSRLLALSDEHHHVVLVGHNPGLSELAHEWLRAADEGDFFTGLGTGGGCSFSFQSDQWRDCTAAVNVRAVLL